MLRRIACRPRCSEALRACLYQYGRPPSHTSNLPLSRAIRHRPLCHGRRSYATEAFEDIDLERFLPKRTPVPPDLPPTETSSPPKRVIYEGSARRNVPKPLEFDKADLQQELRWLPDPLKLADKIRDYLKRDKNGDAVKAVELVKLASRDMPCTVSWNQVIDYYMHKQQPASAVKAFNDMKKRAQKPDGYTFTLLLNGLAQNAFFSKSLERALSIYYSMYAENAPVQPALIHTNAMLKVCAFSNDLDAMLGVAAKLPTKGPGAPDRRTFTVILNAIRTVTLKNLDHSDEAQDLRHQKLGEAVMQGRRLWEEIRDRWKVCDIRLDEELVCAMGRVLLMGTSMQDTDDILSLLEQTMQIPRQIPPLGHPLRIQAAKEAKSLEGATEELAISGVERPPQVLESRDPLSAMPSRWAPPLPEDDGPKPFAKLSKYLPDQHRVKPGHLTLSLALEACTELRLFRPAQDYWGLLTDPSQYDIEPDTQNYLAYLRLLRHQRQSRQTLAIVEDMHAGALGGAKMGRVNSNNAAIELPHKVFQIALSACARDKKNPNALAHAEKLIGIMSKVHERPDAEALFSYLVCAESHDPKDWQNLFNAVRSLIVPVRQLHSSIVGAHAGVKADYKAHNQARKHQVSFVKLLQKLISVLDTALQNGREIMDKKTLAVCKSHRKWLITLVTRQRSRVTEWAQKNEEARQTNRRREEEEDAELRRDTSYLR